MKHANMQELLRKPRTTFRSSPRSGSILIMSILCMAVAIIILTGLIKMGIQHQRQLRQEVQLRQTEWLLDAGVQTAIAKARSEAGYSGEKVSVSKQIGKFQNATIEIGTEQDPDSDQRIIINVTAKISRDIENSTTQRSLSLVVDKPNSK